MAEPTERWLPVVGYEGFYEVSDLGRVRSLDRWTASKSNSRRFIKGQILKPVTRPAGYLQIRPSKLGVAEVVHVHRVVALAFLGPPPPGQIVRHLDGDPSNNTLANLAYGTYGDNERDKVRHGRHRNAQKTHCPKNHEYTPDNIYRDGGQRKCRTCVRERQRRRPLLSV